MCLITNVGTYGQGKKVNEECKEDKDCLSGNCVALRNGNKVCATCNQSTLNSRTEAVGDLCKSFEDGWTPGNSPEYRNVLASDGRVQAEIFDIILEKAKRCKVARETREKDCFEGGNPSHKEEIAKVETSISRVAAHKKEMSDYKKVYYSSPNTYANRLGSYQSKCANYNFDNINNKLDALNNDQNNNKKVRCSDIESYKNECLDCAYVAKSLLNDCFLNNIDRFPGEYNKSLVSAEKAAQKAQDLLQTIKNKSLCE